ncbi:hypothetical protein [Amycolatopsis sp. NPDC003861]
MAGTLTQVRDAADRNAVRVEAESGQLAGGAATATGAWASGGSYVGYLGNGGTLTIPRTSGPGRTGLTVVYAQAENNTGHPYDTDTITRTLVATEAGGTVTRAPCRHNYTWDGFWPETSPIGAPRCTSRFYASCCYGAHSFDRPFATQMAAGVVTVPRRT